MRFARLMALLALTASSATAVADDSTTFTYQGELKQNGTLANGSFSMTFSLWNALNAGSQIGSTLSPGGIQVNAGRFAVVLDFGEGRLNGQPRWLEITVNGNTLSPRQALTPAPVAQALPGLWTVTESVTIPNLIGGDASQVITSGGASVIGGGKGNSITTPYEHATISGGWQNLIDITGEGATIGGGYLNTVTGQRATIVGGGKSTASGSHATIAGGEANFAGGDMSFVAGQGNVANGINTAVLGYRGAANHAHSFVWADSQFDVTGTYFSTSGPNQFLISAAGGVGINTNAPLASLHVAPSAPGQAPLLVENAAGFTTLKVNSGGGVEIGPRDDIAALSFGASTAGGDHVAMFYSTTSSGVSKMRVYSNKVVFPETGEVLVGRSDTITSAEYFGVHAPVSDGVYGGMYVSTFGDGALPFYGYAAGENADMWHYYDGASGDWNVFNNGNRFTVENTGEVGIGTVNPGFMLHVNGTAGKPGGGSWSAASDIRLKKNVMPLDGALESLLKLRGVTFEYLDPEAINELPGERIGVIAQEVETVFPDWVEMRGDGYKTVTFRGFEALTVEALRELQAQNDRLVQENDELHDRLVQIETLLAQIMAKQGQPSHDD